MGHTTLKLTPGVNVTDTPLLNEAGVSEANLIRYMPDKAMGAVAQPIGGWTRFFGNAYNDVIRGLWAWEDTEDNAHLAVGVQTNTGGTNQATLSVITNGAQQVITPQTTTESAVPAVSTTSGRSYALITDNTVTGVTQYDSVYIAVQLSVGGIVLFGLYQCNPDGYIASNAYHVEIVDVLGNPLPAPSSSSSVSVPNLATTSGSSTVTVTLPNHGYQVGDNFPVVVATTVGGVTFQGHYPVAQVIDTSTFVVQGNSVATSTTSGYINGGNAYYIYGFGIGAVPTGSGFGVGGFGLGGFGTGSTVTATFGSPIKASDWIFDNYGELLIAVPIADPTTSPPLFQPIYYWDPEAGQQIAQIFGNGPVISDGAFVAMPQRQIIAWGTTFNGIQDPLLVRWCDVNNTSVWIANTTNQAGSYRLTRGSKIIGGIQAPQQSLLWTDVGLWSMSFIGAPDVYGFNEIGVGCGLIGRKAMGLLGGVVYWMGTNQFYSFGPNGIQTIPCDVWDVAFQDIDFTNAQRIRCAPNSSFNEIAWYLPTLSSGGEVSMYVKYNVLLGVWDYGYLARTAWLDKSVLGQPLGTDPVTHLIYQHETSPDADGQLLAATLTTGWYSLADGDNLIFLDQWWPDMKWGYFAGSQNAQVSITLYAANYPGDTPQQHGPYTVTQSTQYFSPRIRKRLVRYTIETASAGSFWRVGANRARIVPDGKF